MEIDDPRAIQWIEIGGDSLNLRLGLIRRTIEKNPSLLAVVKVNNDRHGVAPRQTIDVFGVASHFTNIMDTIEHEFAGAERQGWREGLDVERRELVEIPKYIHPSCSAEGYLFRATVFTLVRIGESMCGHFPSRKIQLAVIPVGYVEGYTDFPGNRGSVPIRGRSTSVVGQMCMNNLVAAVTDIPRVSVNDEAVQVVKLASLSDVINPEVLARPLPATRRVMV